MQLWFVLGTAAELIKIYPLIRGAEKRGWIWRVVSTGQSGANFWRQYDEFQLPRSHCLDPLRSERDLRHSAQAGRWFFKALSTSVDPMNQASAGAKPWIVVHGDTLSTVVGCVWGRRLKWPIAHVEAGLRSGKWWQPFPEEINRRIVSRYASLHFAPDEMSEGHLRSAGVAGTIVNTKGNSLYDAVHLILSGGKRRLRPMAVANLHRYENLNSPPRWKVMMDTLLEAAKTYEVVFVLHPQTEHKLKRNPSDQERLQSAGVEMVPRMMFAEFLSLVDQSTLLISDGGSNQEECFYLGKPCLILRETTERQEGLGTTSVLSKFDWSVITETLAHPEKFSHAPFVADSSPSETMLNSFGL